MSLSIVILAAGRRKRVKSDLPVAAIAATLLLANVEALAQAETTPAQPAAPDAKQTSEAIVFDRHCASPEIPLDSAPLRALSLDPEYESRFQPPALPLHARAGTTRMHLLVNEQGQVVRGTVVASHGDRRVDEAVLRSVEQWRFKPRYLDAKPVCAWGSYALKVEIASDAASTEPKPDASQREP